MHIVHLVCVECPGGTVTSDENQLEAAQDAYNELESSGYGDGDVFDWFEIGGRWSGLLDGHNAIRYSDNPDRFRSWVEWALENRNDDFRLYRDYISGRKLTAADAPQVDFLGKETTEEDRIEIAERITKSNQEHHKEFKAILKADKLRPEDELSMTGYYLYKLGKLVSGYYMFESRFVMVPDFSVWPDWTRIEAKPDDFWLVVMDLHN